MISQHQYQVVSDELEEARDRIEDLERENEGLLIALSMPTNADALTTEQFALEQQVKGLLYHIERCRDEGLSYSSTVLDTLEVLYQKIDNLKGRVA